MTPAAKQYVHVGTRTLRAGLPIDANFKQAPSGDVMRYLAKACDLNIVVPDTIDFRVTAQTKEAPCDQLFETMLESEGLWYDFTAGRLLRIMTREQLQLERDAERMRNALRAKLPFPDPLPDGAKVTVDLDHAPLRPLLQLLATRGGINLVLPDAIDGRITVHASNVEWTRLLETVLAAEGLGFRYRMYGQLLRIAPQTDLDAEDAVLVAHGHL